MRRMSRTTWYLVFFCVFLLAVNITLGYFLIRESSKAIRTQIESRMLDVSNTAAAMLDGNALRTLRAEDKDTEAYQTALRTLSCFAENIELEYIYCIRDMGNGNFVFMIDPDPESPGAFGSSVPYTDALYQASLGNPSVDQEPYLDRWGRFYSAYSPVYDDEKSISSIVVVDFSAQWYENQIYNQVFTTLKISGISLLFAVVIVILITSRYRKRFQLILKEMNIISGEIETLVHETAPAADSEIWKHEDGTPSGDEIQSLGDRIHSLQQKLSDQITLVRSRAYVDGLTGLGNRTAYEDQVKQLDEEIKEGNILFSIAVFDLNGLKEINDTYGHGKGDEVIRKAAHLIRTSFPDGKAYRIGGDEFIVILEGPSPYLEMTLEHIRSHGEGISMSAGSAEYHQETDTDYHMVFNRADVAMYDDKREYYRTHGDRRRKR